MQVYIDREVQILVCVCLCVFAFVCVSVLLLLNEIVVAAAELWMHIVCKS